MSNPHPDQRAGAGAEPERAAGSRFRDGGNQDTVEASADGIVAVDERGIIRLANPAAEMLFARPNGDLVGSAFGAPTVVHQTSEIDLIRPDGGARVVEMRVTATTLHG
ncbi:PAS domain-containing protein [Saccharopolyspora hattusasensis]|uniref:PAS domain-containing protein n=1 Tax=Saccharopolyspora hattusasensis TaxID=1128679 RepID=UPI003D978CE1